MTTVLIIEDNEDNLSLMTQLLQVAGYKVAAAETGEAGYEKAVKTMPDFILLDIQLPDIDGTEVLQRLRANDLTSSIPVIAVTSYAMVGDRERLLSSGCNGYIEKPVDPELVIKQIQNIIKRVS